MINEKPILMNSAMVNAALADIKTNTRRVIKNQPEKRWNYMYMENDHAVFCDGDHNKASGCEGTDFIKCPYGKVGDSLWVRETWALWLKDKGINGFKRCIKFKADDSIIIIPKEYYEWWDEKESRGYLNRPSIHMPKWTARLWLKIKEIRVERLQEITEEDAEAEGIDFLRHIPDCDETLTAKQLFWCLWDSINGKPRKDGNDISWNANPWVWVVVFERFKKCSEGCECEDCKNEYYNHFDQDI